MNNPASNIGSLPHHSGLERATPWWVKLVVLLAVFLSGTAVGGAVAFKFVHLRMEYFRDNPDALPQVVSSQLNRMLGLSTQQTDQVQQIMKRRHPRIIELRTQSIESVHQEFDLMTSEIASVLDARQTKKWSVISRSVRDRFLPK